MKRKQTLKTEDEKTIRLLVITLGVIIATLLVVFLFQTGHNAQKGYQLEQVRIQNDDLKNLSEGLKAKATNAAASSLPANKTLDAMAKPESEQSEYLLPEDND
ncbi:hypothetical protein HOE67_02755 [Candidatus Peregrinibacteria bacterium]|nr:hypothetical protein [Candidatus Peregrinibacteria bacterium]